VFVATGVKDATVVGIVGRLLISEYEYDGFVAAFAHAYTSEAGNEAGIVGIVGLPLKSPYAPVVATVAKPETAPAEIAIATFDALVTLPFASTTTLATELALPYVVAVAPESANLATGNVPELILLALDVSVVAEAANPETALEAIAIATLEAVVILPFASTTTRLTLEAVPYVVALTPESANLAAANVPELILVAFVVSVVADATNAG
jgi:hypothetical protein